MRREDAASKAAGAGDRRQATVRKEHASRLPLVGELIAMSVFCVFILPVARSLLPVASASSNHPRLLHCLIAIDELDAEFLRLGVHHEGIACGDAIESIAATLLI
jgi:hypothetical protein